MQTREPPAVEAPPTEFAVARAPESLPVGIYSPQAALTLQRQAGNRAVARLAAGSQMLARDYASGDAKRSMREGAEAPRWKDDTEFTGPEGDQFVWDEFDRTLTIFTSEKGPNQGKAFRITYAEGSADELSKMSSDKLYLNAEVLSPLRAKALKWLRGATGLYQETDDEKTTRVTKAQAAWKKTHEEVWTADQRAKLAEWERQMAEWAKTKKGVPPPRPKGLPPDPKPTLCNLHVGHYGTNVLGKNLGGMDPRQEMIDMDRAGAFKTLESDPFKVGEFNKGPQAGDIISYGIAGSPLHQGGARKADFQQIMHVGVLKSRRPGKQTQTEIWTVVDGGQGGFESRQEVRERVRIFTIEKMEAQIAKTSTKGNFVGYEMDGGKIKSRELDVGVFKQKPTDYIMRGWVDIDTYATGKSAATASGAGSNLFAQKSAPDPPASAGASGSPAYSERRTLEPQF